MMRVRDGSRYFQAPRRAAAMAASTLPASPLPQMPMTTSPDATFSGGAGLELEPVEAIGAEGQAVGTGADDGKGRVAEHLDRPVSPEFMQVEVDGLSEAGKVCHTQHD